MRCEQCEEREATVHIKQMINGELEKFHLCVKCASEHGYFSGSFEPKLPIGDMLGSFLHSAMSDSQARGTTGQTRCPSCGLTYSDFAETGFMGCAECYRSFGETIKPVIKRVHGDFVHRGKCPDPRSKTETEFTISDLKRQLEAAIEKEEFERAAKIRDQLRDLEAGNNE